MSNAEQLWVGGYGRLLPIIPPDGELPPDSKISLDSLGKVPGILGEDGEWRGFPKWQSRGEATLDELEEWLGWDCGFGLLTATHPIVDVDITDELIAEKVSSAVEEYLYRTCGGARVCRIGNWPKRAFICRTETPWTKRVVGFIAPDGSSHKVELLGDGQQAVILGTHPKTGKPYRFEGTPLWEVAPDELPLLDEERADRLIQLLTSFVERRADEGYRLVAGVNGHRSQIPVEERLAPSPELVVEALKCFGDGRREFDNRDFWVAVGHAAWAASDDDPAAMAEFIAATERDGGYSASKGRLRVDEAETFWRGIKDVRSTGWGRLRDLAKARGFDPSLDAKARFKPIETPVANGGDDCDAVRQPAASRFKATGKVEPNGGGDAHVTGAEAAEIIPPVDIFGDPSFNMAPELDPDWLPPAIADFVVETARLKGCDPALVALPCLVVLSSAVREGWRIQPKVHDTTWTEQPCMWGAVVADVSVRKSPPMRAALRPLKKIQADWVDEDKLKDARFKLKHDVWKKQYAKHIELCAKDEASLDDAPVEPRPLPKRRLTVDDITTEKLCDILKDNPSGLLQEKDELAGWFGSFDAYRSGRTDKDRPFWLEAYEGSTKTVDRATKGSIVVPNLKLSIIGGIQPTKLEEIAPKLTSDGLLQRFIPVYVESRGAEQDVEPDGQLSVAYEFVINNLLRLETGGRCVVKLSPAAQAYRSDVKETAEAFMHDRTMSEAFRGHMGKWEAMWVRLLLVYHLIECSQQNVDAAATPVSGASAQRVHGLFLGFFLPHAIRFYEEFFESTKVMKHAKGLALVLVAKEWHEVSRRELWRAYRHNDVAHDDRLKSQVLDVLYTLRWISPVDAADEKGRLIDVRKWHVNPSAHTAFAEQAEHERKRRTEEYARVQRSVELRRRAKLKTLH